MEYKFINILNLTENEKNIKIELSMRAGTDGESYIERRLKLME